MPFDKMLGEVSKQAKDVASRGRYGDDYLLHVSGKELEFLDSIGALTKNPDTGLPEAFSLGKTLLGGLFGNKPLAQSGNLENLAGSLKSGADSLIPSVTTGNLPPGAQTLVNNSVADSIQSIKSKYAQLGMSGSTVEAQEISQAQSRGQAMSFQIADELTRTGIAEAGLSANIYETIMKGQIEQDQGLQNALSNFAGAAALGFGSFLGKGGGGGAGAAGAGAAAAGGGGATEAAITGGGFEDLLASAAVLA